MLPLFRARRRQRGLVLVLAVIALLLIALLVLLGVAAGRGQATGAAADDRLQSSLDALLAHATSAPEVISRPGQFPSPDNAADGNYDGLADDTGCLDAGKPEGIEAIAGNSPLARCLGKLPWQTLGLPAAGIDPIDAAGVVPWYAVSANLAASNACLGLLNPVTLSLAPGGFACPTSTAPPFPWLKVCDANGRVLTDRAALVVIIPGPPLDTPGRMQRRTSTARPGPREYLDALPLPDDLASVPPAARCDSLDNAGLRNEFVAAPASAGFNDRVSWITVDALATRMEQRAAQEMRRAVATFAARHGRFPTLAPLADPSAGPVSFVGSPATLFGLVPVHSPANGHRVLTEMAWAINTTAGGDTINGAGSSPPQFACYAGAFRCRIRRLPGGGAIPGTVSAAEFSSYKSGLVGTPVVACAYKGENRVECDPYTRTETTAASYLVQRRPASGGAFVDVGAFPGTRTRRIIVTMGGLVATGSPVVAADAVGTVRRSITTSPSAATDLMVDVIDTWTANAFGTAPFDHGSSGSLVTGNGFTGGNGRVTVSNLRVYPVVPDWYTEEHWHEFMLAAISPDTAPATGGLACAMQCLESGAARNIAFLVLGAGAPLAGQSRALARPQDFLEEPNLAGIATRVFAGPGIARGSAYADLALPVGN